jgi:hypothetical protein
MIPMPIALVCSVGLGHFGAMSSREPRVNSTPGSRRKAIALPMRKMRFASTVGLGVGSVISAPVAREIENAVDYPDRVEGAAVAALERHLARPVMVDPVIVA